MRIAVLCKGRVEDLPPVMTVAMAAAQLGHDVYLITSFANESTTVELSRMNISLINLGMKESCRTGGYFNRISYWTRFHRFAWSAVNRSGCDLLWIGTADTALALGPRLLSRPYILQLLELYDNVTVYRHLLRRYAQKAKCVVVPEETRAAIISVWYQLARLPVIVPNKPLHHPCRRELDIEDCTAKAAIETIQRGRKILLYQGHISADRDLRPLAEASRLLDNEWKVILLGRVHGNYLNELVKIGPQILWLPEVPAPRHLQITSHAHVGMITYSRESLNNVFCAPNKVWEYSGFEIPMICSDLPPLRSLIERYDAGICVQEWNSDSIVYAVEQIYSSYDLYRRGAAGLFGSVDVMACIKRAFEMAEE